MFYENYIDLRVYGSQNRISLPKASKGDQLGKGCLVYLLSPTLEKSAEIYKSNDIGFIPAHFKYFTMDYYYKRRIGTKMILVNERSKLDRLYREQTLPLEYRNTQTLPMITKARRNLVVDLSRWMDLFFSYRNPTNTQKMCDQFIELLADQLKGKPYSDYKEQVLLIDLESWAMNASCVLMSRKLLNNPLSILMYTAYYYPELMNKLPNIRIMLANRNGAQVLLLQKSNLNKQEFAKVKNLLKKMKNVTVSVEDLSEDTVSAMSDDEVKAEIVDDFKRDMQKQLSRNLVGNTPVVVKSIQTDELNPEIEQNPDDSFPEVTPDFTDDELIHAVADPLDDEIFEREPEKIDVEADEEAAEEIISQVDDQINHAADDYLAGKSSKPVTPYKSSDKEIEDTKVIVNGLPKKDRDHLSSRTFIFDSPNLYYRHIQYDNEKPIGFIDIYSWDKCNTGKIILAVDKEYRSKGIAQKMVTKMEKDCTFVKQFEWEADLNNTGSVTLAKKLGYKKTGSTEKTVKFGKTNPNYWKATRNDDVVFDSPTLAANAISPEIKARLYKESYISVPPTDKKKAKAEAVRVEKLKTLQDQVFSQTLTKDMVEKKSLKVETLGVRNNNNNPNLQTSKFASFDKQYAEKLFNDDIDNAVKMLSKASDPIYIIDRTIEDTSDEMNLKQTYRYSMEDRRGNKMSLVFDVPIILDGTYVYLNGSKKVIGHQFILKPIVKTAPDTVQLVTSYNKVFVYRMGSVNENTNNLISYMKKNPDTFNAVIGNYSMANKEYDVPLDFNMMARYFRKFTIGDLEFHLSVDDCLKTAKNLHIDINFDINKEFPYAINRKNKTVLTMPVTESFTNKVLEYLDPKVKTAISKIKRKPKLIIASAKMLKKLVPVIVFCMFCDGFYAVMEKAKIAYQFVDPSQLKSYNHLEYDYILLQDLALVWKKDSLATEMLMNGLKTADFSNIAVADLDKLDTYVGLIAHYYNDNYTVANAMSNYRDFLIDDKTAEILTDFGFPTDITQVFLCAVGLLSDTKYLIESNMHNMRVRSTEVIADIVYTEVTAAYNNYRKTAMKKKPTKVTIARNAVIRKLLSADTNLIQEFSVINPMLEVSDARTITYKGLRGIQLDRALTLPRRGYNSSMLGVVGISTPTDGNVGITRQLALEPNITSTRGYIDVKGDTDLDSLNSANLFTAAELLNPLCIIRDDPDRSSMAYKQSKYMIPVADADPVLIGNRVETVMPYIISDEFVVNAKEDGKVIAIDADYVIIEYKSGKRSSIDISKRIRKNSASGFFIDNTLTCNLKVGQSFKKDDILAYNDKAFKKNDDDPGASMKMGVLTKIAILSTWDIYEDSAPITAKMSKRLASELIDEKAVSFSPMTHIDHIVKIGDTVQAGESLIKFSEVMSPEMQELFNSMRDEGTMKEIAEDTKTVIQSKHSGEVVDIKVYTTLPPEELDPSLAKIVKQYQKKITTRNNVLSKYQNPNDYKNYKLDQIISDTDTVVQPSGNGKIKGEYLSDGVLIFIYIKYLDIACKGDKVVATSALKNVIANVIPEGQEPYSEYRPDEEISTIVAPLSIAARKTPSIFLTMFGNKILVELKRQLEDMWLNDAPLPPKKKLPYQ